MVTRIGNNPYAAYLSLLQRSQSASAGTQTGYNSPVTTEQNPLLSTMNRLQTSMNNLRGDFSELGQQASSLKTGQTDNAFAKSTVTTENTTGTTTSKTTAVTATATGNATAATYSLTVSQVAQAQENQGDKLDSFALNTMQAGRQTFDIVANNKTKSVALDVQAGDTNMAVLDKMASAINGAKAGVTAKVVDETANGQTTSKIVITANQTGTANGFKLQNGSADLVDKTNAGKVTRDAQVAKYAVNGKEQESQTNQVKLDNGKVALNLNAATATNSSVTVGVKRDNQAIIKQVTSFVDQYNKTVNQIADAETSKNLRGLTLFADSNRTRLADIGLKVNQDKTITLDKDKLDSSLTKNFESTKNLIGGSGSLASWASDKSRTMISATVASVDSSASANAIVSSKDYRNQLVLQQLSQYTQMNNQASFTSKYGAVNAFNFFL